MVIVYAYRKIICALLISMSLLMLLGCSSEHKYVELVKNGTMQMEPDIKIGRAFDEFFANPQWKYFDSTDNHKVVEFNGECTWWGQDAHCSIQFIITSETTFELWIVKINDQEMNKLESAALLHKALTNRDDL